MPKLNINGVERDLAVTDDIPLLWAIRDVAGLTGTKFGCGQALCAPAWSMWTACPSPPAKPT